MYQPFCTKETLVEWEREGLLYFCEKQLNNITCNMLIRARDKLWSISKSLKLSQNTTLGAVNMFNAYVSRKENIEPEDLDIVVVSCLFLYSKCNEIVLPYISAYIDKIHDISAEEQVEYFEKDIFITLGCTSNIPNEGTYLNYIIRSNLRNNKRILEKCYILLGALSIVSIDYLPSVISTSVVELISPEKNTNPFDIPDGVISRCMFDITYLISQVVQVDLIYSSKYSNILSELIRDLPNPSYKGVSKYRQSAYYVPETLNILIDTSCSKKICNLGEGGNALVVREKLGRETFAVKKLREYNQYLSISFIREISITLALNHENIIKPMFIDSDIRSILYKEYTGDIWSWKGSRGEDTQIILAKCLLSSLSYMHEKGCLHRDIKPGNILVDDSGTDINFILSDFGISRGPNIPVTNNRFTTDVITLQYRPPELLIGFDMYTPEVDVWSVGCTLYEFATKEILFNGRNELSQLKKIFNILGTPSESYWPVAFSFEGSGIMSQFQRGNSTYTPGNSLFFNSKTQLCDIYKNIIPKCLEINPSLRSSAITLWDEFDDLIGKL